MPSQTTLWLPVVLAFVSPVSVPLTAAVAHADTLPTIVTYELSRARGEARRLARDPRSFWVGEIVARIEDRKATARYIVKRPVTVEIGFVVGRDGHVISEQIARSSGDPSIDMAAMAEIDRAAPFPPMPAGLGGDSLAFTVPLRFK